MKLTVVPDHWTKVNGWNNGVADMESDLKGRDIMYWPKNNAGRSTARQADTDGTIMPDGNCVAFRCMIKRTQYPDRKAVCYLIIVFMSVLC